MHFYDFNIGDYAKKTQHLSNEEDLAYRRALDMYYDTEKPLPVDNIPSLSRRLRVGLPALETVIAEFFPKGRNQHADEVIKKYYIVLERQRTNGRKGGRPKNQVVIDVEKPSANPLDSQNNPTLTQPLAPTNHYPLTTNQEDQKLLSPPAEKPPKVDPIPYQKIIDLYHQLLPANPQCLKLSTKRKAQIGARWRNGDIPDLENWKEYFEFVAASDWLTGKCEPTPGRTRFVADIEWLTNETNFTKIYERKYHGR